jgi:hypothetical protein
MELPEIVRLSSEIQSVEKKKAFIEEVPRDRLITLQKSCFSRER